ncbi:MAG: hypothetical protein PHU07_02285 [Acidocella sp.]|nr:hypothetical protein [Acidocella sp.]
MKYNDSIALVSGGNPLPPGTPNSLKNHRIKDWAAVSAAGWTPTALSREHAGGPIVAQYRRVSAVLARSIIFHLIGRFYGPTGLRLFFIKLTSKKNMQQNIKGANLRIGRENGGKPAPTPCLYGGSGGVDSWGWWRVEPVHALSDGDMNGTGNGAV